MRLFERSGTCQIFIQWVEVISWYALYNGLPYPGAKVLVRCMVGPLNSLSWIQVENEYNSLASPQRITIIVWQTLKESGWLSSNKLKISSERPLSLSEDYPIAFKPPMASTRLTWFPQTSTSLLWLSWVSPFWSHPSLSSAISIRLQHGLS